MYIIHRKQIYIYNKSTEVEEGCTVYYLHSRRQKGQLSAFCLSANVSSRLAALYFTATIIKTFSGLALQTLAVYLLIVCFLNIGYQTENWQLTTCSFFMLQYPVKETSPSVNNFRMSFRNTLKFWLEITQNLHSYESILMILILLRKRWK